MILSAGLSPAWQQILAFDAVHAGHVNRARSACWCASGKALNVARAIRGLQGRTHLISSIGGLAGEAIRTEFRDDGIPATWIETRAATRVCTTLIDKATTPPQVTELVENAAAITTTELQEFETAWRTLRDTAAVVVMTGSLPEVVDGDRPVDLWARLLVDAPPAILDVRGPELLAALSRRPLLVKPNREELAATVGRPLQNLTEVIAAMQELNAAGAEWVLTSDGGQPALLTSGQEVWRLTPPAVQVVNPIGCGDCLTAGVAVAVQSGQEMPAAVRFGMAAAVINLGQMLPARLRLEEVEQTDQDVRCERIA